MLFSLGKLSYVYILPMDITLVYIGIVVLTGFLFLARFRIRKPGLRGILAMVGIGAAEFVLLILWRLFFR